MPNEASPLNDAAFKAKFRDEITSLKGKKVVVTGGTTGLGRATVLLLLARGANVLTFGRHQDELDEALADFKQVGGGEAYGLLADASKPDDVARVFGEADTKLGGIDAVVCNAALAAQSILDSEYDEWRKVIDVNLLGYMLCCRAAADRFRPKKDGHLVCVGSMSAKVREADSDVYVATKSGIEGFTDSLAKLLNKEGVRVSLIEPGLVGADMTAPKHPAETRDEEEKALKILRAEEIAHAVVYCLEQPKRCNVALIQIRPTAQTI